MLKCPSYEAGPSYVSVEALLFTHKQHLVRCAPVWSAATAIQIHALFGWLWPRCRCLYHLLEDYLVVAVNADGAVSSEPTPHHHAPYKHPLAHLLDRAVPS